jgi:hypothetical protein
MKFLCPECLGRKRSVPARQWPMTEGDLLAKFRYLRKNGGRGRNVGYLKNLTIYGP